MPPGNLLAGQTFKRRSWISASTTSGGPNSVPGGEVKSSGGGAVQKRSWRNTLRQRRGLAIAVAIGAIVLAVALVLWWLDARHYISTDDAFIDTRTVQISAQVAAAIIDVPVTDNQVVGAGSALVRLDDRDYVAQVDQAKAQVEQAQASITNLAAQIAAQRARIEQADRQVTQAEASLTFAQQQAERYEQLAKQGTATTEQAQQYSSNLLQSQASLAAAQANAIATDKQEPVLEAQRKLSEAQLAQAQATLEEAQANLSRTVITAPVEGRVTRLTAAKGGYAAVGQALMMYRAAPGLGDGQLQGDRARPDAPGTAGRYQDRRLPRPQIHRPYRQHSGRQRHRLQPAPGRECDRQLRQDRAAHPGQDRVRSPPDVELGPGMSVVPTVKVR